MDSPPLISLILTTYNRAAFLRKALDSIAKSNFPDRKQIELIVVDNNSTDETPKVMEELNSGSFPFPARGVKESSQGLSYARNRGLREATGQYVVFMDDDEMMHADYLSSLQRAFRETGAMCVGGPVLYYNADDMPAWLASLSVSTGQLNLGNTAKILGPDDERLNGGNMAFIRSELLEVGEYDVRLGRRGKSLLSGEDYELQDRIRSLGKLVAYHPDLVQYHYLRPERYRKSYWRRLYFAYGQTVWLQHQASAFQHGKYVLGVTRWLWFKLAKDLIRYVGAVLTFNGNTFRHELDVWAVAGRIAESRRDWVKRKRSASTVAS